MILALGKQSDETLASILDVLESRGEAFLFLDQMGFTKGSRIRWDSDAPERSWVSNASGEEIHLDRITAVFNRLDITPNEDSGLFPEDRRFVRNELKAAWAGLLDSLSCPLINPQSVGQVPGPYFADIRRVRAIRAAGLATPALLVTSDLERALDFSQRCRGWIAIGSPSNHAPQELLSAADAVDDLRARVERMPIYLMEIPPGEILRVYVVGNRCWAAHREADGSWNCGLEIEASPSLSHRCRAAMRELGWPFVQFDLAREESGMLWCLAVTDQPAMAGRGLAALRDSVHGEVASLLAGSAGT